MVLILHINSSFVYLITNFLIIADKCTFCKIMTPMEYAHEEMANRPLYKQVISHAVFNLERKFC